MKKATRNRFLFFPIYILLISLLSACSEEYTPKPKGYNYIPLPEHDYQKLTGDYPFEFEYSKSAEINIHQSTLAEPHWLDIKYPKYNSMIQITYKKLKGKTSNFDEYINDSHKLANKHNVKAYSIDEGNVRTPKGYGATIFELSGEVPSQFQFYITDSVTHFMRGAVYFPVATQNDSLAPVIEFIKFDAMHLVNTVDWKSIEKK